MLSEKTIPNETLCSRDSIISALKDIFYGDINNNLDYFEGLTEEERRKIMIESLGCLGIS